MPMNLKEILDATATGRKAVISEMDRTKPAFHPEDASIYMGLSEAKQQEVHDFLLKTPLKTLMEKLAKHNVLH